MIILASASPRRSELLNKTDIEYKVIVPNIDEVFPNEGSISDKIMSVALDKANAIYKGNKEDIVIAADTVVVFNNELLGKPTSEVDALDTLSKLNNNTHSVITAVAVVSNTNSITFYEESFVTFKNNSIEELKRYVDTKEPLDKAGSYAIQGIGACLVDSYKGDLDNIIGLPLNRLLLELKKFYV